MFSPVILNVFINLMSEENGEDVTVAEDGNATTKETITEEKLEEKQTQLIPSNITINDTLTVTSPLLVDEATHRGCALSFTYERYGTKN